MKKFFIVFIIILALLISAFYFTTTEYFFNKYIANNIKEYNFNYKSAKGSLLRGFKIKELEYKGKELSSSVDFKFNPFKLLEGKISIDRLHLEDVNKKTLTKVIKDFKPKEDNSKDNSSSIISLNFEFKDILLTIKPFEFNSLRVDANRFEIDYLSYIDGKFNLGDSKYFYKTNFGDIDFSGKFKDGVLYIDKIDLLKLDLKRVLNFISAIKSNDEVDTNSSSDVVAFLPKSIIVKSFNITLKPFNIKNISAKDIKLLGDNAEFNVEKLMLKRANLNLNYKSNLAQIDTNINFDKNVLNIKDSNIDILQANKIEEILNLSKNGDSNSIDILSIIPIKYIKLDKTTMNVDKYTIKNESIDRLNLLLLGLNYNLDDKRLTLKDLKLKTKSSLADINLNATIDNKIYINNISLDSNNANKIKTIFSKTDSDSNSSSIKIPDIISINKANIKFKNLSFLPYIIKKGAIKADNLDINISKFNILKGNLDLFALSNWGKSSLKGYIKDSNFYAEGRCRIDQNLLKEYSIPIKAKNLKELKIKGKFGLDSLELNSTLEGKDILTTIDNLDILNSKNHIKYNYINNNTIWNIDALIKTPYTQKAKLKNSLEYINDKLRYSGELKPIKNLDVLKNYKSVFDGLRAKYYGDSSYIDLLFSSNKLKGELKSSGYKGGVLKIINKEGIKLNSLVELGDSFKNATINKINIEAPIDFDNLLPIKGVVKVRSNLFDINGDFIYNRGLTSKLNLFNPKYKFKNKNLKIKAFFPTKVDIDIKDRVLINIKNPIFKSIINYKNSKNYLNVKLNSNSLSANAEGNIDNIKATINSKNIYKTIKEFNKFYKITNIPKVNGSIKSKININGLKKINIIASSNKIEYKDKKSTTKVENILVDFSYKKDLIVLNRYKFKINGYTIFANKSTNIVINGDKVVFSKFWINDLALLNGNYFLNTQKGSFKLNSNNFKIKSNDADMNLKLNTKITISKNKYAISGLVDILNAVVKKNLTNKKVSDNDDIIILQRQQEKKSTKYAKNIKLDIKLISRGGIVYSQGGSYFKMYPNLKIKKRFGSLTAVSGTIKLDKKSYYKFRDKKLRLKEGVITFKGKSSTPYLNIVMYYKGKEYKIYINISGTPARPILYFSSNPPLTKDEILAYLLFDDSSAAGTHSQQSMLNLIGGTLAKSFFGALGVKIDHVSIKENGFSIGKNINDNITIFYNQEGDKPSIKTRIDIIDSVHTDIEIGEESQSADIIFSKEY